MSKPDEQEASSSQVEGAQGVPPPHAPELRGAANPPFLDLHGRSVAVRVPVPGGEQVLFGRAEYAKDRDLGQVLRIVIEGSGGLEIVLEEAVFHGQILRGDAHQRDFVIDVAARSSADVPSPKLP